MSWFTWIFLESLPALGALLFTVNFFLLVYWRRSGRVRPLLIGLGAAIVLLIVQAAVVTHSANTPPAFWTASKTTWWPRGWTAWR